MHAGGRRAPLDGEDEGKRDERLLPAAQLPHHAHVPAAERHLRPTLLTQHCMRHMQQRWQDAVPA
jgi:hypothetical protein